MAENTTDPLVPVTGEPHTHPALRRLARACIALVRWQRAQTVSAAVSPPADTASAAVHGGDETDGGRL